MFEFLFGNKKPTPKITDFIWKTRIAKYRSFFDEMSKKNRAIIAYYFSDTKTELHHIFTEINLPFVEDINLDARFVFVKAEDLLKHTSIHNYSVFFVEHHPSFTTESNITQYISETFGQTQISFYISLDEPIFQLFGVERIMSIMEKMGYKEDEYIHHNMVSESIKRSQQKIDQSARRTLVAKNAAEWLNINMG